MSKRIGSSNLITRATFVFAIFLGGCSDSPAAESAESDGDQSPPQMQLDGDDGSKSESVSETDVLIVDAGQPPFPEPDLERSTDSEEVSEEPAAEPTEAILDADPEDGGVDSAQAGLGSGESALCGTIQIGYDAVTDGATDLARSQRATLLDRADSLTDAKLAALVSDIADEPLTEVTVLGDALDRCVALGFER